MIELLKKINSKTPDFIKDMFAPIIRRKLINNSEFLFQYALLDKYEAASEEQKEIYQFEELKKVIVHAYHHTKYYKKLFDDSKIDVTSISAIDDLKKIPLLSKEMILSDFNDVQADDIKDFYRATTGGTSGKPLTVNLDRKSIYKERAFIYHYWSHYGYDYRTSKLASFRGTDFNGKLFKSNPLYREIQYNPCLINKVTIYEYVKKMDKFHTDFIHGFPSAIYNFCRFAQEENIPLKGKYKCVFFISENVYPYQRNFVEEYLGCQTVAFYGHTERSVFAEEYGGLYHFNKLYGYIEFSESNEIICTGFLNPKMPLIRYKLDDTAIAYENGYCIIGHRDGLIYGKDGIVISLASLEIHSHLLDKISNYQFEQKEKGKLIVNIVPFDISDMDTLILIQDIFQQKVGTTLDVEVKCVQSVKLTERGKFRLLIQHINN